ncbi:unnamed protein product, partial [Nesidiocoris tenuis]
MDHSYARPSSSSSSAQHRPSVIFHTDHISSNNSMNRVGNRYAWGANLSTAPGRFGE